MEPKKYVVIENGVAVNTIVATPEYAEEHGLVEQPGIGEDFAIGHSYENGKFLPPPRDIDAEWEEVRKKRDQLLLESDVYVLPDRWAQMTTQKQMDWSTYRQELRDLPQAFADPQDIVWPTKPES